MRHSFSLLTFQGQHLEKKLINAIFIMLNFCKPGPHLAKTHFRTILLLLLKHDVLYLSLPNNLSVNCKQLTLICTCFPSLTYLGTLDSSYKSNAIIIYYLCPQYTVFCMLRHLLTLNQVKSTFP